MDVAPPSVVEPATDSAGERPTAQLPGVSRRWLVACLSLLILAGGALVYSLAPGATGPVVTVSDAYVREPASPDVAAAYLTITNHTNEALTLTSITSTSARSAHVMTELQGAMTDTTLTIPGHGSSMLEPNAAHLMLDSPHGVTKGRTVQLTMRFNDSTSVQVDAPVIGVLDPAPTR